VCGRSTPKTSVVSATLLVFSVVILALSGNWLPGAVAFFDLPRPRSGHKQHRAGQLAPLPVRLAWIWCAHGQHGGRKTGCRCGGPLRLCGDDGALRHPRVARLERGAWYCGNRGLPRGRDGDEANAERVKLSAVTRASPTRRPVPCARYTGPSYRRRHRASAG
jgi:hypothetical protein